VNTGWNGLDTIGGACLVPGSVIRVFKQSPTVFTAVMVDQDGVLNNATLDLATGWQGPDTVGNTALVPGTWVSVL
jgi:hypothetical protein